MNFNEIQELIRLVNKSNLTEFKLKDKDFEVQIRTKKYYKGAGQTFVTAPQIMPSMPPAASPASFTAPPAPSRVDSVESPGPEAPKGKNVVEIKSPIVGTFYRSPGPDKPLFTKVGDQVKQGDVVCIIEAMKLFNEIESDVTGTVVKVLVEDASPVEYDQVLFLVEV
ncbi:MAG: acetyl-CoA carboxylase biotin carboxyl carrier protein [Saprospiraceae bacterium]|nr:acetyl-CoA carboxylase biotin carboxyl carrier protein [Saprospiraceae bacterium]MBK8668493.1 acetyl-CoA carboxylase biotin carboxyl carrier protein [Saprospiraceae bacterium]